MRKHNGIRPQDICILLKIISLNKQEWTIKKLSEDLFISQSEICEALNRSSFSGLIDKSKKIVMKMSLFDFLVYGLKYVFPAKIGEITNGVPISHSAPPLSKLIISNGIDYVWEDKNSKISGFSVEPLYKNIIYAIKIDSDFYELVSLVEALRIGKIREINLAKEELKRKFKIEQSILKAV